MVGATIITIGNKCPCVSALVLRLGTLDKGETVRGFCFRLVFNGIGKMHLNCLSPEMAISDSAMSQD